MLRKKTITLSFLLLLFLMISFQTMPMMNLKSNNMNLYVSDYFAMYFEEQDEVVGIEMLKHLESKVKNIQEFLNYSQTEKTQVYLYPNQEIFQKKKYGALGSLFAPDWYIGDNIREKIIIVSPLNPGPHHQYETAITVSVHEYVHTLVWTINPKTSKWLNEGLALYLANQKPEKLSLDISLPTFKDTKTENPLQFASIGGYELAYTYIEFLDIFFGSEAIAKLVKNPENFVEIFGWSEEEIYKMWVVFVNHNYILMEEMAL